MKYKLKLLNDHGVIVHLALIRLLWNRDNTRLESRAVLERIVLLIALRLRELQRAAYETWIGSGTGLRADQMATGGDGRARKSENLSG